LSESRVERRERERREEEQRRRRARDRESARDRGSDRDREEGPRRNKKRKKGKVGRVIALIIILLVAFTALRIWIDSRPGAVEPVVMAGSGEFESADRINILLLGTNQGLSDTIMVFSLDMANKKLDQISIPRDTYYPRPSYSGPAYQKINSVFSTEGAAGASKAASDVLGGIPINYYAQVDTKGAIKIIDAIGGVDMYVPMDMKYSDPDQNLYIDLKAGQQHLNGEQSLMFLRFRSGYANADLGRISAQQEFLKSALSQLSALNIASVALTVHNEVNTNMGMTSGLALAARASGMSGWQFVTYTLPGSPGMQDGLSYFFHDAAAAKEMMRQIYAS